MKDYVTRFNKQAVSVENYSDAMALIAIMARLQPEKFHYSFLKNAPRTFMELLLRAQKYSNADELTNAKMRADPKSQRVGGKKKRNKEQVKNKEKISRTKNKGQGFRRVGSRGIHQLICLKIKC